LFKISIFSGFSASYATKLTDDALCLARCAADSAIDAFKLAIYALDIATNDLLPAMCAVDLANYAFCLAKYAVNLTEGAL